jgi:Amt family ammonium transporter
MIGSVLTGVFASSVVNPIFKDAKGNVLPSGALEGNVHQIVNQLFGVGVAAMLAIVGTLAILKVVDLVVGIRVPEHHEIQGLDLSQHGEEGYCWEVPA